jgi:signal transduction histidine kinase/CheY-like chemotaxis protein
MKVLGDKIDRSISFKLIIPLILVSLGSVVAFFMAFYYLSIDVREQKSQQRALELSEIVASSIERSATNLSVFGIIDSLGSYKDIDEIYLVETESGKIITSNKHQYKNKPISQVNDEKLRGKLLNAISKLKNEFLLVGDDVYSYSYHFSLVSKDRRSFNKVTLFLVLNSKVVAAWLNPFFNSLLVFMLVLFGLSMLLFFMVANKVVVTPIKKFIAAISGSEYKLNAVVVAQHSNDEIGEMVRQYNSLMRSVKEYQESLVLEKEKSEMSAKAKSEFLATMTHEIRTPLNGIIGMSEFLNATTLNKKQQHYANTIHLSGVQLLTVINDVLDFSKIESGKMELNESVFDLLMMIKDCQSLFETQCKDKGLVLRFEHLIPQKQLYIEADEVRLKQVLINLLGNAIKFTQEGCVTIELIALNETESKLKFSLAVKDTGIGISDDKAAHLFDEFTQADSTTTRDFGGTGLGLAICKKICEKMAGRIYASGEIGRGSCFTMEFTLAKKVYVQVTEPDDIEQKWAASVYASDTKNVRVLLVEDTPINLEIAQEVLQSEGFHVEVAMDGKQAIEAFVTGEFDIVLMDCLMPVMDGYEATRGIRSSASKNATNIPIIALTASSLQETKDKCLQAGMNDFLSKPFESAVLLKKMKTWLV